MNVLTLGTLILAVTAVVALGITVRQVRAMSMQTRLSVVVESFREARMPEWWQARDWIVEHLTGEYAPDQGISGLPPHARAMVRKIGFLYDNLGLLVVHKVVPEDLVIGFFGEGMEKHWSILKPYIDAESKITRVDYMVYFRDLVRRSHVHPAAETQRKLGVRWLDTEGAMGSTAFH
jgi:hypothetical protein